MSGRDRPEILYLVHRAPYPPDKGDRIRAFHLLRFLSRRARVHLACLADEPVEPATVDALRGLCERVEVVQVEPKLRWVRALGSLAAGRTVTEGAFGSPRLRAILRDWAGEVRFRSALASASSMVPYLRMKELREVPAVVDLVDVDSQKWLDYAEAGHGPKAWLYRAEGRRLRRLERDLPDWARAVTLVSEAERDIYLGFRPTDAAHAVTNGVDLEYFRTSRGAEEGGCVFVGALDYPPNVDGACWFSREVWPGIMERHPGATLSLVGRRPAPAVRRLADLPGVELIGQVPDVRPLLSRAAVAVIPLRIARGVQNKTLEALATGKAVVASPQALTGLRAEPGVHALTATTPAEWADAVGNLLQDAEARRRLGAAGRRYVEEHHSWDACLGPFEGLLGLGAARDPGGDDTRSARAAGVPDRAAPLAR